MNFRVLSLLAGTFTLAGCSSGANGSPSTAQPGASTTATVVAVASSPTRTSSSSGSSASAAIKAGQNDLHRGKYSQAERQFRRAIASGNNTTAGYAGLGSAAAALKDYPTSYTAYKKALAAQPHNPGYLYGAAYAALYASDYKGAVKYASQFIALEPKDVVGYHLRMQAYGRLIRPKQQLADARQIIRLKPREPQANNDLGIAYANNKKYRQSLAAFSHAIQLQPGNFSFYQNRAIVENLIKDKKAAIADVRKAIALAPDPGMKKVLGDELHQLQKQS